MHWSDIYGIFINFPFIFKFGKISPVTVAWTLQLVKAINQEYSLEVLFLREQQAV